MGGSKAPGPQKRSALLTFLLPLLFWFLAPSRPSFTPCSWARRSSKAVHRRSRSEDVCRSGESLWPEMFDWVKGTGMDVSDIQVRVEPTEDLAKGELGIVATSKLVPGDILAWAPTSLLLSKPKAVELWGDVVEALSDRVALILLLIQERYVHGKDSKWYVYMRSLPQFDGDVSGPSFLWTEDELEWLQGSDGYGAAAAMYNTIVDEYVTLNESLFQEHSEKFPSSVFTFDHFLWGAATVASRAYGDDAEGTHLCIAPLVDFLNHRAGALQLTRFGNGIVAYAHKHYDVGEQVWVSYGGKSNAELLSQYGFVDPDNGQEAVYIRLGVHLQATGENAVQKMALIQDLLEGAEPEGAIFKLALRPREWEPRLLPILRTLAWSDEDELPKEAKELVPRQSPEVESQAYAVLEAALLRRASEYPATLAADREQLKAGGLSERNALGLKLRISEQELIELIQTYAVGERSRESESA